MDAIPASIPFNLAKAYATPMSRADATRARSIGVSGGSGAAPEPTSIDTIALGSTAIDRANLAARAKKPAMASLVAAKVNASPIDELNKSAARSEMRPRTVRETSQVDTFEPSSGARAQAQDGSGSGTGAYPFYRHPAAQNAAATGVDAGRRLDAMG